MEELLCVTVWEEEEEKDEEDSPGREKAVFLWMEETCRGGVS